MQKPFRHSVWLRGVCINLSAIARAANMDMSYVCRIFMHGVPPRVPILRKIAAALGMGLEDLLDAIEERRGKLAELRKQALDHYFARIKAEDEADLRALASGRTPLPRLPGTRITTRHTQPRVRKWIG